MFEPDAPPPDRDRQDPPWPTDDLQTDALFDIDDAMTAGPADADTGTRDGHDATGRADPSETGPPLRPWQVMSRKRRRLRRALETFEDEVNLIHTELSPREFTRFQKPVLWASGVDMTILRRTGVELNEFLLQGSGVLLTTVMATAAVFVASDSYSGGALAWHTRLLFGLLAGLLVFVVDRMIVRSNLLPVHLDSEHADNPRMRTFVKIRGVVAMPFKLLPRLLIAVIVSYFIAEQAVTVLFSDRVEAQVVRMLQADQTAETKEFEALTTSTEATFEDRRKVLREQKAQIGTARAAPVVVSGDTKKALAENTKAEAKLVEVRDRKAYFVNVSDIYRECANSWTSGVGGSFPFPAKIPAGAGGKIGPCKVASDDEHDTAVDRHVRYKESAGKLRRELTTARLSAEKSRRVLKAAQKKDTETATIDLDEGVKTSQAAYKEAMATLLADEETWKKQHAQMAARIERIVDNPRDALLLGRALGQLVADTEPSTLKVEELDSCTGGGIGSFFCQVGRWILTPTPMGVYVTLLRDLLFLIDLTPILFKIYYVLRPRRPYDTFLARLEAYSLEQTKIQGELAAARLVESMANARLLDAVDVNRVTIETKAEIYLDSVAVWETTSLEAAALEQRHRIDVASINEGLERFNRRRGLRREQDEVETAEAADRLRDEMHRARLDREMAWRKFQLSHETAWVRFQEEHDRQAQGQQGGSGTRRDGHFAGGDSEDHHRGGSASDRDSTSDDRRSETGSTSERGDSHNGFQASEEKWVRDDHPGGYATAGRSQGRATDSIPYKVPDEVPAPRTHGTGTGGLDDHDRSRPYGTYYPSAGRRGAEATPDSEQLVVGRTGRYQFQQPLHEGPGRVVALYKKVGDPTKTEYVIKLLTRQGAKKNAQRARSGGHQAPQPGRVHRSRQTTARGLDPDGLLPDEEC